MRPQVGVGGGTPRPRKLRLASKMIMLATITEPITMTEADTLGSTCRHKMRRLRAPMTRAASTSGLSRTESTSARTTLKYETQVVTARTRTTLVRLGPTITATAMARMRNGMACCTSATRLTSASTHRPTKPATSPSSTPSEPASAAAATPTTSDTRPPNTMRLSTSRPRLSVPSTWPPTSGGWSRSRRFCAVGPKGAIHSAPSAHATTSTITSMPSRALSGGRRRALRLRGSGSGTGVAVTLAERRTAVRSAAKANPWIEPNVTQVDHDVDHHDDRRGEGDKRLNDRHIARGDGFDGQAAHTGIGKDALDHDGVAQDEHDLQRQEADDWQRRVAHGVADEHRATAQALGVCRSDVVLGQGFQQARPEQAGERGRGGGADGKAREDQTLPAFGARRRQPVQIHGEDQDEHDRQPERRD